MKGSNAMNKQALKINDLNLGDVITCDREVNVQIDPPGICFSGFEPGTKYRIIELSSEKIILISHGSVGLTRYIPCDITHFLQTLNDNLFNIERIGE